MRLTLAVLTCSVLLASHAATAAPPDPALVGAIDRVGKALLGEESWAAHLGEIDARPVLVLDLSASYGTAPDVVVDAFVGRSCRRASRLFVNSRPDHFTPEGGLAIDPGAFVLSDPPTIEITCCDSAHVESPLCSDGQPPTPSASSRSPEEAEGLTRALDALGKRLIGETAFAARRDAARPEVLVLEIGTHGAVSVQVNAAGPDGGSSGPCAFRVQLFVEGGTEEGIRGRYAIQGQSGPGVGWLTRYSDLREPVPAACGGAASLGN